MSRPVLGTSTNSHQGFLMAKDAHPQSSASALLARLALLLHRFRPDNDDAAELQQAPTGLHPRLSTQNQRRNRNSPTTPSGLRPDALFSRLSSIFRSQPHTNEEIELPQRPRRLQVVEVAAVRDRQVLYIAPRPRPDHPHTQPAGAAVPGTTPALSRLL
ncbi:hypothetical protein BDR05DRAFT_1005713 [Suillus weaverae]|nr:hypothetical protein BDR05DRAFT_1005713 [Suillus weaverae]